jgi:hypothetical protein
MVNDFNDLPKKVFKQMLDQFVYSKKHNPGAEREM